PQEAALREVERTRTTDRDVLVDLDQHVRLRLRLIVDRVGDERDPHGVRRQPREIEAPARVVLAAFRAELAVGQTAGREGRYVRIGMHAAVVEPLHVAVARSAHSRDAGIELVRNDREVAAAPDFDPVQRAVGQRDRAAAILARLSRIELDRAADRVTAGQRALRTAQHLDAIEVEQIEQRARQRRVVDVVDVDTDARLERVVEVRLTDAANESDHRRTDTRARGFQRDVRRLRGNLEYVRLTARLHHRGGDRGDRDRRILNVGLAELGRDDDFLDRSEERRVGKGCRTRRAPDRSTESYR